MKLNRVPLSIILDMGTRFTSHFWKPLQKGLDTKVKLRTTSQSQMDGQENRTIQNLDDTRVL